MLRQQRSRQRDRMTDHGVTLIEILIVSAAIVILTFVIARFLSPVMRYFQREPVRQTMTADIRRCLDTIDRAMSEGNAQSLIISTPLSSPTVQLSRAQFSSNDGSSTVITWSASPMNTVHILKTVPGVGTNDQTLASHVTGFHFDVDLQDPSLVTVTLQMTVPLDASGAPDSIYTITLPATVRMMGSQ
jgi:Tfp pilus assembly protein PilE